MDLEEALTRLAREDSGRVLAVLTRLFNDLDLADEAVQDGLVEAVRTWPARGVPDNPAGWLLAVARRKAIDRVRRESTTRRRTLAAAPEVLEWALASDPRGLVDEEGDIVDDRLRLMLLCCHPALAPESQVALTLRLVGGLTTREVAAGLLVSEATVTQRIVRAKRKIRDAGIPLTLPAALDSRVDVLLGVLYLIYNEGYLPRAGVEAAVRVDLADEAIRLTTVVRSLLPDNAEVRGLLALMSFQRSRFATRISEAGELVLLEDQDRARWDSAQIVAANGFLAEALQLMRPGPFQVQAVIASLHANARVAEDTDWAAIADAYRQLEAMTRSPVVRLNRAVAVGMADGPPAGLAVLETITGLEDYHLFHAARGDLLTRAGDVAGGREAFARARALAVNPLERRYLESRL